MTKKEKDHMSLGNTAVADSTGERHAERVWKRYQVSIHGYGRRLCRRDGPAQGLLEWPEHTWGTISTRPMGLKAAIALADAQSQHAVVTLWMSADVTYDNGKAPAVPEGWWPPTAQTTADPREVAVS